MSNPLIDKYEEIYGEKKEEEVVEEKKSPLSIKEMKERYTSSGLLGAMGDDHIIFGGLGSNGGSDTITLNPSHTMLPPVFNINDTTTMISNGTTIASPTQNTFIIPNKGVKDEMLCKVLKDVETGKAKVYNISSQVDKSFTGFGGQICYTIEIVATYP